MSNLANLYTFQRQELLDQALTHKSKSSEGAGSDQHNEKLEFLGDAVLDLVLSELLMERFPKDSEGSLSKKRASLVNEAHLAQMALTLELPQILILGKGERQSGGEMKPRLLASCLEAVVGAIFLDGGYSASRQFVEAVFDSEISRLPDQIDFEKDFKTRFQEMVQSEQNKAPTYKLLSEKGPSHAKRELGPHEASL